MTPITRDTSHVRCVDASPSDGHGAAPPLTYDRVYQAQDIEVRRGKVVSVLVKTDGKRKSHRWFPAYRFEALKQETR